jgi:6-phosphogluconolactonase (cycloisomerase 2 family)
MIALMRFVTRASSGVLVALAVLAWWASPGLAQRLLFVSNDGSSQPTVSVFAVGASGGLTAVGGSPFNTGGSGFGADAMVLTPDGSHLYVTNFSGSVSGLSVSASGALAPVAGSPWLAGAEPGGLAITPSGKYLFATNGGSNSVSAYSVGSDGVLTPLGATSLGSGQTGPGFPAITPNGEFLYVPDSQGVVAFAIGSGGSLTTAPGSPYALSGDLQSPAAGVAPNGDELLVGMGYGAGTVAAYSIAANGVLTTIAGSPFTAVSGQSGVSDLAVSPTGGGLYATDGSDIAGMSIGASGTLAALPGSPFSYPQTASQPQAIAVAPGGGEAFADDPGNNVVQAYTVAGDGALTANGSPVPTGDSDPDEGGITVGPDRGPTAMLVPTAAPAGSASTFDASKSTATEGTLASFAWNFGDGSSATTSSPTAAHVYTAPGTYTVTLTVTSSDGCSTTGPFTGQSPSCTADPAATTSSTITIPRSATPLPATSVHTTTLGNQRVTLITPSASACQASSAALSLTLSATKLIHGTKLKFERDTLYIDRGIRHVHTESRTIRRHGKPVTKKIKVTTYLPNATVTRLPASEHLSLDGLRAGTHTLTVKLFYAWSKKVTTKRHGKKTKVKETLTDTKKLTVKFTVC